jgi:hypothetical protein
VVTVVTVNPIVLIGLLLEVLRLLIELACVSAFSALLVALEATKALLKGVVSWKLVGW